MNKYIKEFLDFKFATQASPLTIKNYTSDSKIIYELGLDDNSTLEDFKALRYDKVYKWGTTKLKEGNAPTTINRKFAFIRALYKYLSGQYHFENTMVNLVKLNDTRKIDHKVETQEEVTKLLGACDNPRDKFIISCLFSTGVRASELLSISFENIDGNKCVIIGKGNKPRVIEFNKSTMQALENYKQFLVKNRRSLTGSVVDLTYNGLRKVFMKINKNAGLNYSKIHSTRHYVGTKIYEITGDIEKTSKFLGHASSQITSKYYVHPDTEGLGNLLEI